MHFAEEGQHMVLAQTEHFDVLHNHHFVIGDSEQRVLQHGFRIFVVSLGEELEGFVNASGRA